MLPLPFEDYIPKLLRQNVDTKGQAFIDKHDDLIEEQRDSILGLKDLKDPLKMPAQFIPELNDYLAAGIKDYDSAATKRKKLRDAVQTHKNRGTWSEDAKLRIDNITGYSAAIYAGSDPEDSIEMGGVYTEDDTEYWSTERGDDTMDTSLGTWEIGFGTEYVVAGNIYIDCHQGVYGSTLTSAQIEQIVTELQDDVAPAYMIIYLCYIDVSGGLNVYTGGIIS